MTSKTDRTCRACGRAIPLAETPLTAAKADGGPESLGYICEPCWLKVARGGRLVSQTLEAIMFYENDDNVGGPDDPLDHEDYRDLELLGLWLQKD